MIIAPKEITIVFFYNSLFPSVLKNRNKFYHYDIDRFEDSYTIGKNKF